MSHPQYDPTPPPAYRPGGHIPPAPTGPAAGYGWQQTPTAAPTPEPTGFITTPAPSQPPAGRRNPAMVAFLVLAAVVALGIVGTTGYVVWDRKIREDTGVAACKAMAKSIRDGKAATGQDKGDDAKLTEAQYHQLRDTFAHSRHADIKTAGTGLVDTIWEMTKLPKDKEMEGLAFLPALSTNAMALKTACGNHGVEVDLNLGS